MSTPRSSVGRYELRGPLGAGGMGTVWHAWDPALQRDVAVKEVVLPEGMSDEDRGEARERTLREAQATARIRDNAVVTVHDVLEHEGTPWIVMELLSGRSLQHHLDQDGPVSAARVEEAARSLLSGLRAAHAVGVTHRDVKPANIMLTEDGRTVLTDFGIANVDGSTALTQTGVYIGSPEYMAPERFEGERALPASDMWSLGVTLYALLEGRSPFKRESVTGIISAVLTAPMPPRLSVPGGADDPAAAPLRGLIGALLDRDASSRPTAEQALELLDRAREERARDGGTAALPAGGGAPGDAGAADGGAEGDGTAPASPTGPATGGGAPASGPGTGAVPAATGPQSPSGPYTSQGTHTPSGPHTAQGPYAAPGPRTPSGPYPPGPPAPYPLSGPQAPLPATPPHPAGGPQNPYAPHPARPPQGAPQGPAGPTASGPRPLPGTGAPPGSGGFGGPTGPRPAAHPGTGGGSAHTGRGAYPVPPPHAPRPGAPVPPAGHPGPGVRFDRAAAYGPGRADTGGVPVPGPGRPPAPGLSFSVVAACAMLGLNGLYLLALALLSLGGSGTVFAGWGGPLLLTLWGGVSAASVVGLLLRSRLVYGLVVLLQVAVSVALVFTLFTVVVYTPEDLSFYLVMLLFNLVIGGLLLFPPRARAYFRLGASFG
ncbi:Serine/threonine protein kinase [Nocardiopsis flavescens]|uniref:non-specific serine/threonine protein kinase n=1 Tax=Nocardiopsis flavescens TaxID=758803 RepID=A0A1M6VAH4_9ACTN|nr:serine/threonine-protein kinase [Nocardiopsis flavescens]SHK78381.1 Serine/threonine protein kinase [Nocardiopsis flavescens]